MLRIALLCVSLGFMLCPNQSTSQPLQIDERFGVQAHFPEGWALLSEDLYSYRLQGQIFASASGEMSFIVEKPMLLSELNKEEWTSGVAGHRMLYANTVKRVESNDWLFAPPDFAPYFFSKHPNGISVFYAEAPNWIGYVIFISKGGTFTKINITANRGNNEPDVAELDAILATLTFTTGLPEVDGDPFTLAERLYRFDNDYEQALFYYKQVPKDHPKYVDAQRAIGYRILGERLNDWISAIPYVEEAYRVAPEDPAVLETIGRVYLKTDRIEEGIHFLEQAGTRTAQQALNEVKPDK